MPRTLVIAALLGSAVAAAAITRIANTRSSARVEVERERKEGGERGREESAERERETRGGGPLPVYRASPAELAVRNRVALAESAKLQRRARLRLASAAAVPGTTWVSLGPTEGDERASQADKVNAGRINDIVVDPRDPGVVYIATSGGGVWKTFDLDAAGPTTWFPLSDTLPNLAAGALAIDLDAPDTLYVGNGDFFHTAGNTVAKTTDGGATWSPPIVLGGTYPAPGGFVAQVRGIRSIAVHGPRVLVGTDVGLFASTDAGAQFALVDLPNPSGNVLPEAIWTVAHTGDDHWIASGVTGCDEVTAPLPPRTPGAEAGPRCRDGNYGAIWTSDDGVSWTLASLPAASLGRIDLATGRATTPGSTVVYAFVGVVDHSHTLGFWRSMDGGHAWTDATGTLANPTMQVSDGEGGFFGDCLDLNLGFAQGWYDQAIAVDPSNPDHVLVGGVLCGARTLNGTASQPTWELVTHWSPHDEPFGTTANGPLPFVHADWQTATIVASGGVVRALAGTDGGVFTSDDVFSRSTQAEHATWVDHNRGITTHLMYSVASGDPATSNPFVLFGGLQDNGTRYRSRPDTPSVFDTVVGGDGIGATVHVASSGTIYWASSQRTRMYCLASTSDCALPDSWVFLPRLPQDPAPESAADHDDSDPFFIHYANVETDGVGQSVLTHSVGQVFVSVAQADGKPAWQPISQDLSAQDLAFTHVAASSTIPGLYGASAASGFRGSGASPVPFYVTAQGNTLSTWIPALPVRPAGSEARMSAASTIAFPPVLPAGTVAGQVYIGGFAGTLDDPKLTPPPDDQGRLYRTADFGQTWTSIVGADPEHRLPNVPVYVVKYDPVSPQTIYAGTDLGVYVTLDDGVTWDRMGDGLPMVPVRDLYIAKNQEFIRVATFGRGLWEIFPSAGANRGAPGNGDYDRNLQIDWIDVAAMASRLGATPATALPPFYSWILDVSGANHDPPVQAIDEADLAGLVTRFGGRP